MAEPKSKTPDNAPMIGFKKSYRATCNMINVKRKIHIEKETVITKDQFDKLPNALQKNFKEITVQIEVTESRQ